jgi:signal peptidase I
MGRSTATQPAPAGTIRPSTLPTEPRPKEGYRDTIEAVVVAFILALVVRGFEAQAFVIPTGSMAPTLMGRHKEVACPQCGFTYAVNASDEVDTRSFSGEVSSGVCVNCRYQDDHLREQPSFKGDRILVMMFPYDLPFLPGSGPPERWDVVVFRYPEEPELSYIKRLIGLPGETIRIAHGDVYVKAPGSDTFALARKPLRHQSAMQIVVYDDRYRPRTLADRPEWMRWQGQAGWKPVNATESRYNISAGPEEPWAELRYHHLVPEPDQWEALITDRELPRPPRATLVTDFYSYNTNQMEDPRSRGLGSRRNDSSWKQLHWVGDLTLESSIEVTKIAPGGAVRFELVEAGISHHCTIDLETGSATFTRGNEVLGKCPTPMRGLGRYQLEFANVDDRMTLTINGKAVGAPGFAYTRDESHLAPTVADLAPAAVAVSNVTVEASDLVLKRDIYYTQSPTGYDYEDVWDAGRPVGPTEVFNFLADPERFPNLARVTTQEYPIGTDRFFMMGDNSPRSKDSRAWTTEDSAWDDTGRKPWEVPRELLTGKAFYVYWPHGVPFGPDVRLNRDTRLIFRPYVERMKWIR